MTELPDHVKEAEAVQLEIYRRMSPGQKVKIAMELYDFAWKLKAQALRDQHPDWTEDQVQAATREIFLYARS